MADTGSRATLTRGPCALASDSVSPTRASSGVTKTVYGTSRPVVTASPRSGSRLQDPEVVRGDMGEVWAAGDVTGGPYMVGGRTQVIVDEEVSAIGQLRPCEPEPKVVGDRRLPVATSSSCPRTSAPSAKVTTTSPCRASRRTASAPWPTAWTTGLDVLTADEWSVGGQARHWSPGPAPSCRGRVATRVERRSTGQLSYDRREVLAARRDHDSVAGRGGRVVSSSTSSGASSRITARTVASASPMRRMSLTGRPIAGDPGQA